MDSFIFNVMVKINIKRFLCVPILSLLASRGFKFHGFSRKINGIKPSNNICEAFLKRTTSLFSFEDLLLNHAENKPYHFSY